MNVVDILSLLTQEHIEKARNSAPAPMPVEALTIQPRVSTIVSILF